MNFTSLRCMRWGILLALITLLFGFSLGGAFGAFEDNLKGHLENSGKPVLSTVYGGDKSKLKKVIHKSWVYFKRAHLHANGLGTTALVLILLLSLFPFCEKYKALNSFLLGIGSLGYSSFWLLAGLKAPALGGTHAAKEALKWLAIPSAGACIIGVVMVLGLSLYSFSLKSSGETEKGENS